MDILKLVYKNPSICRLKEETFELAGKEYPLRTPIAFPTKKSREYTLGEAVFFILKGHVSFTEYVAECQKLGISPLNYLDQISLKDDIENFRVITVPGRFLFPVLTSNKNYDIASLEVEKSFVLISDITSRVNKNTIIPLLTSNYLDGDVVDLDEEQSVESFEYNEKCYTIYSNLSVGTPQCGWENVSALFFDISPVKAQEWLETHRTLNESLIIFSFQEGLTPAHYLQLSKRKIVNYEQMWQLIDGNGSSKLKIDA